MALKEPDRCRGPQTDGWVQPGLKHHWAGQCLARAAMPPKCQLNLPIFLGKMFRRTAEANCFMTGQALDRPSPRLKDAGEFLERTMTSRGKLSEIWE